MVAVGMLAPSLFLWCCGIFRHYSNFIAIIRPMLDADILGNPARAWASAGALFLGVFVGLVLLKRLGFDRLRVIVQRTHWEGDDILVDILDQVTIPESLVLSLFVAAKELALTPGVSRALWVAVVIVLSYRGA